MARIAFAALLLLVVPAVAGQAQAPAYLIQIQVSDAPLAQGESSNATVTVGRVCPNAIGQYDATQVKLAFVTSTAITVSGPESLALPAQQCALEQKVDAMVQVRITAVAPSQATQTTGTVKATAAPSGPLSSGGGSVQASFAVALRSADTQAASGKAPLAVQASPMPVTALVALLLLGAAAVTGRRFD